MYCRSFFEMVGCVAGVACTTRNHKIYQTIPIRPKKDIVNSYAIQINPKQQHQLKYFMLKKTNHKRLLHKHIFNEKKTRKQFSPKQ